MQGSLARLYSPGRRIGYRREYSGNWKDEGDEPSAEIETQKPNLKSGFIGYYLNTPILRPFVFSSYSVKIKALSGFASFVE